MDETVQVDQMTARHLARALYIVESRGAEGAASWEDSKSDMVVKARRILRVLATRGMTASISKETA